MHRDRSEHGGSAAGEVDEYRGRRKWMREVEEETEKGKEKKREKEVEGSTWPVKSCPSEALPPRRGKTPYRSVGV